MTLPLLISSGVGAGIVCGILGGLSVYVLKKPVQPGNEYSTNFIYSGNLKQTSIIDAIQFLEIGKREGILHIYSGRRKGYITFAHGKVIDAFYRNLTAREAMYAMLELTEGDFYFESKPINQPPLIADSIMDIVMAWHSERDGG